MADGQPAEVASIAGFCVATCRVKIDTHDCD
jgi:hypothetical protein